MFEEDAVGAIRFRDQRERKINPNACSLPLTTERDLSKRELIQTHTLKYWEIVREERAARKRAESMGRGMQKTYRGLPDDLTSVGNYIKWLDLELYHAFVKAAKGKHNTADEYKFEMNLHENLRNLRDSIIHESYHPSASIAFITHDPVEREIFAAPFRDRVVHHLLFNLVAPWWDRRFNPHSFSCRDFKGTLSAVQSLSRDMARVTDGFKDKTAWGLKFDISGFFMGLYRPYLFERAAWGARQQFRDNRRILNLVLYLWHQIIFDNPVPKAVRKGNITEWYEIPSRKSLFEQPPNYGIVIGNLTSQLLSNIYLDSLDRFITHTLGYKYYGRYVDDFYILVKDCDKERALSDVAVIDNYLRGMHLKLHPIKRSVQPLNFGMDFVGVRVYPGHTHPGRRLRYNFETSLKRFKLEAVKRESVNSYLGLMAHLNAHGYIKQMLEEYQR